jgi:imidazoleglycerol phosphate synthase glutamine amidotransferase subunit HisH
MSSHLNRSDTEGLWEQQINKRLYFVHSFAIHGEESSNYSRNVEMEGCWFRMSNSDVPADVTLFGGVSGFRRCGASVLQD